MQLTDLKNVNFEVLVCEWSADDEKVSQQAEKNDQADPVIVQKCTKTLFAITLSCAPHLPKKQLCFMGPQLNI